MMMGLGAGGVAVGMFHLITHAFFKALLFLGAGSVIHGCHEEQDIRSMGGLAQTHARDLCHLRRRHDGPCPACRCSSPAFGARMQFSTHCTQLAVSQAPFLLGVVGALLTAFYMTRQMCYVFSGITAEIADSMKVRRLMAPTRTKVLLS